MDATRIRARRLRNNATDAERHLWQHLRRNLLGWFRFRRQMPIAGYIADFACPELKLVVELDGGQHLEQQAHDARRTQALEGGGYRVLRYWNDDALVRTDAVLEDILHNLLELKATATAKANTPLPNPPLRLRRKGGGRSKGIA